MTKKMNMNLERYKKQILMKEIGEEGQVKLLKSNAVVIGCGALGSVISNTLARMGVGKIKIIDRDFVEEDNLHRQILFDEDDIRSNLPKAVAAARKLERINSHIEIEPVVADLNPENIESLIRGANCIIDGTDNFETRFLLNDAADKLSIPWIYGGVVAAGGMSFTIIPGLTPCFRCFMRNPPEPGTAETCDTAGVLTTAVSIVASIEATEAIKILSDKSVDLLNALIIIDAWSGTWRSIKMKADPECPVCRKKDYDFLNSVSVSRTEVLCGRNAIQISPANKSGLDFVEISNRLRKICDVAYNDYMLKFSVSEINITLFKDGRAIIKGSKDIAGARALYSKYIGQ
jgi:adenylyltransferase/sulfurtransferase